METVAAGARVGPATGSAKEPRIGTIEPSADGGVLVLAHAWSLLTGGDGMVAGVHWPNGLGPLLLFAMVGLPVLAVASVRAVALRCGSHDPLWRALGWGRWVTQRRLARFVASPRQDWVGLLGGMARAVAQQAALTVEPGALVAVDTTVTEKPDGPCLPGRRPVYSSSKKRLVDGYELVSACVVGTAPAGGVRTWPLGLLPHQKSTDPTDRATQQRRRRKARDGERPSKLDLALTLVGLAAGAGVPVTTVVGDSAFAVMWWLREVEAMGLDWLVATRQDRRLRIGAEIRAFTAWAGSLPLTRLDVGTTSTQIWAGRLPDITLLDRHCNRQGLPGQAVYFERRTHQGTVVHRWYLVTSHRDWDLLAIWQHWQWRWQIEVLHRDTRQHLHLDAFHVRTWSAIVALVACSSLRASLLAFLRAAAPTDALSSTEALVAALRLAACLVQTAPDGSVVASLPTSLRGFVPVPLDPCPPFPRHIWPVRLRAA